MLIRVMLCFLGKVEGVSRGIAVLLIVILVIIIELHHIRVAMDAEFQQALVKGAKILCAIY